MEMKEYLSYLDELSHEERSVFFYRIVFNLPCQETANRLRLSNKKVGRIFKMLLDQKELLLIKEDLIERYGI